MNFTGKILLADDEAHIRKFIGILVRRLGSPTVIEAREGQEAVELFSRESPDLVLLDISMPVLDGLQALAAIRQADPEAVVIMLTSMTNRKTIDECLRLGATAYLRKDSAGRGGGVKVLRLALSHDLRKDIPHLEILAEMERIIGEIFEDTASGPTPLS